MRRCLLWLACVCVGVGGLQLPKNPFASKTDGATVLRLQLVRARPRVTALRATPLALKQLTPSFSPFMLAGVSRGCNGSRQIGRARLAQRAR